MLIQKLKKSMLDELEIVDSTIDLVHTFEFKAIYRYVVLLRDFLESVLKLSNILDKIYLWYT